MSGASSRNKGAEWRVVPFATDYEVSDDGRVRRITAARTRRAGHGAANHNSILNDNAVRAIRAMHGGGAKIAEIARAYEVGWTCIGDVVHGKKWTHVV